MKKQASCLHRRWHRAKLAPPRLLQFGMKLKLKNTKKEINQTLIPEIIIILKDVFFYPDYSRTISKMKFMLQRTTH
jgi:hypothetical protein